MSSFSRDALINITTCLLLFYATAPSAAAPIGEATEARNEVTGQLGTVAQQISVGTNVSSDEIVSTGSSSSTALRFLDNSALNIGSVSTVILDRYIYDPDRGSTDAFFNLTKGGLRFVSAGRRTRNASIGTPVATIGIRGTDMAVVCDAIPTCGAAISQGSARVCPVPTGTQITQSLRDACLQGNTPLLPCGYYDITAQDEQTDDDEGNFIAIESSCVVSGPQNVDVNIIDLLNQQLASGAPLPDPSLLAALKPLTPAVAIAKVAIPAFFVAVPIYGLTAEPVSK